jgi:hypothetical protein
MVETGSIKKSGLIIKNKTLTVNSSAKEIPAASAKSRFGDDKNGIGRKGRPLGLLVPSSIRVRAGSFDEPSTLSETPPEASFLPAAGF